MKVTKIADLFFLITGLVALFYLFTACAPTARCAREASVTAREVYANGSCDYEATDGNTYKHHVLAGPCPEVGASVCVEAVD